MCKETRTSLASEIFLARTSLWLDAYFDFYKRNAPDNVSVGRKVVYSPG